VTGELPRTISGTPSFQLAAAHVRTRLDEMLGHAQAEYGLTDLEMAFIIGDAGRDWLRYALRDQQKRSKARQGAIT
jgi:hypothetical protein